MKTDMSAEAVTARLRQTVELRRLCLSLGRGAGRVPPTGPTRPPGLQATDPTPPHPIPAAEMNNEA